MSFSFISKNTNLSPWLNGCIFVTGTNQFVKNSPVNFHAHILVPEHPVSTYEHLCMQYRLKLTMFFFNLIRRKVTCIPPKRIHDNFYCHARVSDN